MEERKITVTENDQHAIRFVIGEVFKNWTAMNPDLNDEYYSANDETVLFDVAPMKDVGWRNQKQRLRGVFESFEDFEMAPDDIHIKTHGQVAWVATTWKAKVLLKEGTQLNHEGRATFVLQKMGDRWFVVHDHISVPLVEETKCFS
jgi:ketosteroid isomerase-like protein